MLYITLFEKFQIWKVPNLKKPTAKFLIEKFSFDNYYVYQIKSSWLNKQINTSIQMFSIILFKTILINVLEYYLFEIINEKGYLTKIEEWNQNQI